MKSTHLKHKVGGLLLPFFVLFTVIIFSGATAQAQYRNDGYYGRGNRGQECRRDRRQGQSRRNERSRRNDRYDNAYYLNGQYGRNDGYGNYGGYNNNGRYRRSSNIGRVLGDILGRP
jgi:hypothetical protein